MQRLSSKEDREENLPFIPLLEEQNGRQGAAPEPAALNAASGALSFCSAGSQCSGLRLLPSPPSPAELGLRTHCRHWGCVEGGKEQLHPFISSAALGAEGAGLVCSIAQPCT